jgi:hypothetical protein
LTSRFIRTLACVMLFATAILCAGQKNAKAGSGDPFAGKWKLNTAKSRFLDKNDRLTSMTRTYQRDGDKTKVTWQGRTAAGKTTSGSYSAKCDGTQETGANNSQITCQPIGRRRVDGEVNDPADPDHRYFTRQAMTDGQTMKIVWYKDAERKQVRDVIVLDRVK